MRCHGNHAISHSSLGQYFSHLGVSQNNLTHIRSFPDGTSLVLLDPRVLWNVHAVIFIDTKCTVWAFTLRHIYF